MSLLVWFNHHDVHQIGLALHWATHQLSTLYVVKPGLYHRPGSSCWSRSQKRSKCQKFCYLKKICKYIYYILTAWKYWWFVSNDKCFTSSEKISCLKMPFFHWLQLFTREQNSKCCKKFSFWDKILKFGTLHQPWLENIVKFFQEDWKCI